MLLRVSSCNHPVGLGPTEETERKIAVALFGSPSLTKRARGDAQNLPLLRPSRALATAMCLMSRRAGQSEWFSSRIVHGA